MVVPPAHAVQSVGGGLPRLIGGPSMGPAPVAWRHWADRRRDTGVVLRAAALLHLHQLRHDSATELRRRSMWIDTESLIRKRIVR
jgi:hypothetical protein